MAMRTMRTEEVDLESGNHLDCNDTSAQYTSQETRRRSPSSMKFWPLRIKLTRDVLIRFRPADTVGQPNDVVHAVLTTAKPQRDVADLVFKLRFNKVIIKTDQGER